MKTENYSASVGKGEFIMNQPDEKMPPCDKLQSPIESMIVVIRGQQVILDRDLAMLYGVETKRLKEQVNRNVKRFPPDFMFRLDQEELVCLRSQIATSKQRGGTRYAPYAFTENGVAMLSSVLHTEKAIATNIQIMRAFTTMRHVLSSNIQFRQRLIELEHHQIEADKRIDEVFQCLNQGVQVKEGIFYDGQIFDAYAFASELIKSAKRRIVLIDNYSERSCSPSAEWKLICEKSGFDRASISDCEFRGGRGRVSSHRTPAPRHGQRATHPTRGGGVRASHLTPGYQAVTLDGVSPQSLSNGIPCRSCKHTSHLP